MLFNSYEFVLIFLPLCVVGYYAIINRYKNNKQGIYEQWQDVTG